MRILAYYQIMKNIHVGVSLTTAYNMTWEEGNRPFSRMLTHGFTENSELRSELSSHSNRSRWGAGGWGWSEETVVQDCKESEDLPKTIFVVIYCSGIYTPPGTLKPDYGGGHGSWGVRTSFVNQEQAETYVKNETKKWSWLWVMPTRHFTSESV
jgi:hypothetical protein